MYLLFKFRHVSLIVDTPENVLPIVQCGVSQQAVVYSTKRNFVTQKYDSIMNYQRNLTQCSKQKIEPSESDPLLGAMNSSQTSTSHESSTMRTTLSDVQPTPTRCFTLLLYTIPWVVMLGLSTTVYLILPTTMHPSEGKSLFPLRIQMMRISIL